MRTHVHGHAFILHRELSLDGVLTAQEDWMRSRGGGGGPRHVPFLCLLVDHPPVC